MKAYFCSGVYHLFNVLNMVLDDTTNEKNKPHLYIFNCFGKAINYFNNIKKTGLFGGVYLIDEDPQILNFKHSRKSVFAKAATLLKQAKTKLNKNDYKNYPLNTIVYDEIFIPGYYSFLHRYFMVINKNRKKINFYDEGLGCRLDSNHNRIKRKFVARVLGINSYERAFNKIFMYSFEHTEDKFIGFEKKIITNHFNTKKELFFDVFEVDDKDVKKLKEAKFVLLPAGMDYEPRGNNTKELFAKENECYNFVIKHYYDKVVLKNHPGSKKEYHCDCLNKTIPFELLEGVDGFENKVIVSSFSTTIFNVKYLFNKEPYIILLYKAINLPTDVWFERGPVETDEIIRKILVNSYSDQSRIFIPNNQEEFIEILRDLNEKI